MKHSTMRRLLAALMMLALLIGIGAQNVRDARANPVFLPLIVGVLFSGLMGVGAGIEMYDGAPKTDAAVGATGLSVTLANPSDSGASEGAVRVPTTTSADSAAAVPAPVPSSTPSPTTLYRSTLVGGAYGTLAAAAASGAAAIQASASQSPTQQQYRVGSCPNSSNCALEYRASYNGGSTWTNWVGQGLIAIQSATECPSGWSVSGGNCSLSNARLAVPDGKQDYTRSGTAYAPISGDDQGAVRGVVTTGASTDDTVSVSGMSASGQPRIVSVQATADGGATVVQVTQKTDGSGATYLEKRTYTVAGSGTVTGATQDNAAGSLTQNAAGTGYVQAGAGTAYTPAAVGSGSGQGSGATDYARQGEAAAAATSIKAGVKIDETGSTGGYVPAATSTYASDMAAGKTAIENLEEPAVSMGSWFPSLVPGAGVACHGLDFRAKWGSLDSTTTLDICPYLAMVQNILAWLFGAGSCIYIWRRFATARSGGAT